MIKIKQAIDYIEENLQEKIFLNDISAFTNLSKYHLHRIFKALTKQKLMDYVRNRKLSQSLNELVNTDLKLIDIAYKYGFDYEQSYIRSFIRLFEVSPNTFRTKKPQLKIIDKINIDFMRPIGEDGIVVEPAIIIKPDFIVVGIKHKLFYSDSDIYAKVNRYAIDFFYNQRSKISHAKYPDTYVGIIKYIENAPDYKYYIPSIEVSEAEKTPPHMETFSIPTRKYAVFKYIGFHHVNDTTMDNLYDTYHYIFHDWLEKSGYRFSSLYHIERIDTTKNRDDYCEIDLCIPVEAKY
jgi:AraC family transcriptional regulator